MSIKKYKEIDKLLKVFLMYQCKNLKENGYSDEDIKKYIKGELNNKVLQTGHDPLKMLKYYDD